ncbi:MAG: cobalamin-dependent protein [Candidatus Kapabacteria bacterium]|nr:cobalamin-dependent protein [Candidatus Kapabacteria bacterium]
MKTNNKSLETNYLNALLEGKRKEANKICLDFISTGNSFKELYEHVMKPSLYEVGKLWEQNKISVATEHLATAITEGIMNSFYSEILPDKYNGKKVVLTCVEKEEHQVGVKMVADVFEMNQWESFFLGTGFPISELIKFIKEVQPDIIAISLSVYFNFTRLKQMLNQLKNEFPQTKLIVGGQALSHLSDNDFAEWKDITYITDLHLLDTYLKNLK